MSHQCSDFLLKTKLFESRHQVGRGFFKNHVTKRVKSYGTRVLLAGLCFLTTAPAAYATFTVPASTRNITTDDWRRFIRAAHAGGGNGVVLLPAARITAQSCRLTTAGTTIRGRGAGQTILVGGDGQADVFAVLSANTRIEDLQVTGSVRPVLTDLRRGRFLRDRPPLSTGLNRAVIVRPGGETNLRIEDAFFRDVNVGVEFEQDLLPHGLEMRRVDFSVASVMVCATARADAPNGQGNQLNRRILLNRLRHVNRDRDLSETNRNMGITGISFDFGNNANNPDLPAVDMRGSIIRNCEFITTSKWNLALNRASNIRIHDNDFAGGGYENDNFTHTLHFEDAGSTTNPILIEDNDIRQRLRTNDGVVITGAVIPAHIWIGVTRSDRAPALRIRDNTYLGGIGSSLVLVKQNAGWDEIRDIPAQIAYTVGNDVPRNQFQRRLGPVTRRVPGRGAL